MPDQTAAEKLRKELQDTLKRGSETLSEFNADKPQKDFSFSISYQRFYSDSIRLMEILGPDRVAEFRGYYEIDTKRKSLGYGTYVIQDFLKGVAPNRVNYPNFDTKAQVAQGLYNQLTILKSLEARIEGVLADVSGGIRAELLDAELEVSRELVKISLRAAGALAGVILEGHLQSVLMTHKIPMRKAHPTISDLNDPLKAASIYDTATWRKISYLADIRNSCCHKKGGDPTKEQVEELIDGVNWAIKTIN